ncbi:MAG: oligosaccharide flippase family protein [Gemmatimonadota bacterium]|jgi:O-antigen/teichoic acid export membrane protein
MREVVHGAVAAFLLKATGSALTFGFTVLVARMFAARGSGVYALALSMATLATVFGRLGLDQVLVRETAAAVVMEDWGAIRGHYRNAMLVAAVASLVVTAALWLLAPMISVDMFHEPALVAPLRWMALAVYPWTMLLLHGELLRGLKRIVSSYLVQAVGLPLVASVLLLGIGRGHGVVGATWAFLVAAAGVAVIGAALWRRMTRQTAHYEPKGTTAELLSSSAPLLWVASLNFAMAWVGTFLLGIWASSSEVGIFNAAARTVLLGALALMAVNAIAGPKFAELHRSDDWTSLGRTARHVTILVTLAAAPVLALLLIAPSTVMSMFGKEFVSGAPALAIMAVGQFVNVATGSVGVLLIMTGHERRMRDSVVVAAAVNVLLNLILIPSLGIIGAAIATAAGLMALNLTATYFVWTHLRISVFFFGRGSR